MQTDFAKVYTLHSKGEYARFFVYSAPKFHTLAIESSFGSFSHSWSSPGESFTCFIAKAKAGYLVRKMVEDTSEFDGERTADAIREEILRLRKERQFTKEEAEDEWIRVWDGFDHECDYFLWSQEARSELSDLVSELAVTKPSHQSRSFIRMYELFWPDFASLLREDSGEPEWLRFVSATIRKNPTWIANTVLAIQDGVVRERDALVESSAKVEAGLAALLAGGVPKRVKGAMRATLAQAITSVRTWRGTPLHKQIQESLVDD